MFQIRRKGNFSCQMVSGSSHCGIRDTVNNFDYEVKIAVDNDALDDRGFIIDNMEIDRYFQSIKRVSDSCELLAEEAALAFWNKIKTNKEVPGKNDRARAQKIALMQITIWGLRDIACLDYIFDRSMGHPAPDGIIYKTSRQPRAVAYA